MCKFYLEIKNKLSFFMDVRFIRFLGILFLWCIFQTSAQGQITNASCNQKSPWISGTYTNLATSGSAMGVCVRSAQGQGSQFD